MEITLQHAGGSRFLAEGRQHKVVIDQPAEDGASDRGMTPAELLLASLGGCVGQFVVQVLRLRGLPTEGIMVRVEAQPAPRPLRLKDFNVEVIAPGLNERQLHALQKSLPAGLVQHAVVEQNTLRIQAVSMFSGDVTP